MPFTHRSKSKDLDQKLVNYIGIYTERENFSLIYKKFMYVHMSKNNDTYSNNLDWAHINLPKGFTGQIYWSVLFIVKNFTNQFNWLELFKPGIFRPGYICLELLIWAKYNTICLLKTESKAKKLLARNPGMQFRSWLHIRGTF